MVQLFGTAAEKDIVTYRIFLRLDGDLHVQIAGSLHGENWHSGAVAITQAKDPQPRYTRGLSIGNRHIGQTKITDRNAFLPQNQVVGKVSLRGGFVFDDEPACVIRAALQLPLGEEIPLLDIPGLAAAGDGAGARDVNAVVGEVDLDGVYIKGLAQVDL